MLTVLDIFSGVGGFSLGLERTSRFQTVAFCEIDPFPRSILAKHWPETPCYEDVRSLTAVRLNDDGVEKPDVICGGFPCQDISVAGAGAGLAGERSGLWREFSRLIGELRPSYIIVENVSALLDRGLDRVLGDLASLGYDAEWHCIPACYIGAWTERDRIWILAYPMREQPQGRCKGPVLRQSDLSRELSRGFERWNGRSNLPPSRLCRGNHGVPFRMDRTKALGNTVVPQIPEMIGRAILRDAKLH